MVGVSKDPKKLGHVIFRNFVDTNYLGKLFLVNPNEDYILNRKCYESVLGIEEEVDLAILTIPADIIPKVAEQCGKKGITNLIIISSGFEEKGNDKLRDDLLKVLDKYKIDVIGPNCLGTYDAYTKFDSLFVPRYKLERPLPGGISFVSQSGAVAAAILDLASKEGYGFNKFVSYGNGINVDETDIIEYLDKDDKTKVICLYVEAVKNGEKFLEVCSKLSKPLIVVKGGVTPEGSEATMSHTGSMAGEEKVYKGVFKQCGIIEAENLEEMFNFAKILEKSIGPKGKRVQIVTNGGGYGILCTDAVIKNGLEMAQISKDSAKKLQKALGEMVVVKNPMDLLGDSTTMRYKIALDYCIEDNDIDIILVVLLYQMPLITTDIVDIITEAKESGSKPIIVVSTGGKFTEVMKQSLEKNGVPCFTFPNNAVRSTAKLVEYYSNQ